MARYAKTGKPVSDQLSALQKEYEHGLMAARQTFAGWKAMRGQAQGGSRQQQQKAAQEAAPKQKQPRPAAPLAAAALPEGLLGPSAAQQAQRHEVGLPAALAPLKRERSSEPAAGPQQAAAQQAAQEQAVQPVAAAAEPAKEEPQDGEAGLPFEDTGEPPPAAAPPCPLQTLLHSAPLLRL